MKTKIALSLLLLLQGHFLTELEGSTFDRKSDLSETRDKITSIHTLEEGTQVESIVDPETSTVALITKPLVLPNIKERILRQVEDRPFHSRIRNRNSIKGRHRSIRHSNRRRSSGRHRRRNLQLNYSNQQHNSSNNNGQKINNQRGHRQYGQNNNNMKNPRKRPLKKLNPQMFTNLFRENKYLCLDLDNLDGKLCAVRCIPAESQDCTSCKEMLTTYSSPFCERAKISSTDRSLYKAFRNNQANCIFRELTCKTRCKIRCKNVHEKPVKCAECLRGCPKAADAFCFTGPQLLTKYNGGKGVSTRIADIFGLQPLLCMDRSTSCENYCIKKCSRSEFSRLCVLCMDNCTQASNTTCQYARYDPAIMNYYSGFRQDTLNCSNSDNFCKQSCNSQCMHDLSTKMCVKCNVQCFAASGYACTRSTDYRSRYMNPKNKEIMNFYFFGIFKYMKPICSNINQACVSYCEDTCIFGHSDQPCANCRRSCNTAASAACKGIQNDPFVTTILQYFNNDLLTCTDIKHSCINLCKVQHCDRGNNYSISCLNCHALCDKAGKATCNAGPNKTNRLNKLYNDIQKFFIKKRKIRCEQCYDERNYVCGWKCGDNFKCSKDCLRIALKACMNICVGEFKNYYRIRFNTKYLEKFSKFKIVCKDCPRQCTKECKTNCMNSEYRCKKQCKRICNSTCSIVSCGSKRNYFKMKVYSEANSKEYFGKQFEIKLQRFLLAQSLRDNYDETLLYRMRTEVFRENRRNILDSIELGEANTFKYDHRVFKTQYNKAVDYETQLIANIKSLYSKRSKEEITRKENTELAIFED